MHLVLFDIDGTLTRTNAVDDECFIRAAREVLALGHLDPDWSNYPHVTDSGITVELIRVAHGRRPCSGEVQSVRDRFCHYLKEAIEADPSLCRPVEGAGRMLSEIASMHDTRVAFATGGWRESALMKLKGAGLAFDGIAFASADDGIAREEIMRVAAARAAHQHGVTKFDSCVYVGDGLWDLRAARELRFPFVGIADGRRAIQLASAGASALFADFRDTHRVLQTLVGLRQVS